MIPGKKLVKYSDVFATALEHVVDAAPERTEGVLYLRLNDCGEPDEVTAVLVGTIALHQTCSNKR